jgi:hypothetical protein
MGFTCLILCLREDKNIEWSLSDRVSSSDQSLIYFLFLAAALWALAAKLPFDTLPPPFLAVALCFLEAALDDIFLPMIIEINSIIIEINSVCNTLMKVLDDVCWRLFFGF